MTALRGDWGGGDEAVRLLNEVVEAHGISCLTGVPYRLSAFTSRAGELEGVWKSLVVRIPVSAGGKCGDGSRSRDGDGDRVPCSHVAPSESLHTCLCIIIRQ